MSSTCAVPIKGTAIRIVQLDVCGNPVTGTSSHVVVSAFTQVAMAPQYETGVEFFEKTADGLVCVNQIDPPVLKRMSLTVDLCSVDPDMTPFVLSARELTTSTPVSGTGFALSEGPSSAHYSMEVWQRVGGAGACTAGGLQQYIYNAWPHCYNTQVGSYTISNDISTLEFICDTSAAGPNWLDGPGSASSYLPAGTPDALTTEHWLWNITTVTPPSPACGAVVLT
jgi:hypothetical protein